MQTSVVPPTDEPFTMQTSVVPPADEPLTPGSRQSYHRQMNRSHQDEISSTTDRLTIHHADVSRTTDR